MALTIQEIIDEADEKYPNSLTLDSKLRKINLREQLLLRTIFRTKSATAYNITAGSFLYPVEYSISKIISVIVNGKRYKYQEIDDETICPPYYFTYENTIGLEPIPSESIENGMVVYHYAEPLVYSSLTLTEKPKFDGDFHMVHVYGLCSDMAEIDARIDLVNGFTAKYNGLIKQFKQTNSEPEMSSIRVV